jgi:dihydroorotase
MHTHLREPGQEAAETIATGTRAAAAGGFTTIVCMPNTNPPIDTQSGIELVISRVRNRGVVNVLPTGCITRGQAGQEMTEIGDLVRAGAVAVTDDGNSVMDAEVMRRAIEYAKMFGIPVLSHCEDKSLSANGLVNEGRTSTILGVIGIPNAAECIMVDRDIRLAELAGGRIHICHVSARESVESIRVGKKRGVAVTAEVTPHHLALTEVATKNFDTNTKMNPPLRTPEDQAALWKGLADGTIDAVATDHAPHTDIDKSQPFDQAPCGVIGLETCVPVLFTEAKKRKGLEFLDLLPALTINPARILGIERGTLEPGREADVTIIDPDLEDVFTPKSFRSKSSNSPFLGIPLFGFPVTTIVGGKVVYHNRKIVNNR